MNTVCWTQHRARIAIIVALVATLSTGNPARAQAIAAPPPLTLTLYIGSCAPPLATRQVTAGVPVDIVGVDCITTAQPLRRTITLQFVSSDPGATLPPPVVWSGGYNVPLGSVIFSTPGNQTLTALDLPNWIGASAPVFVMAAPATPVPSGAPSAVLAMLLGALALIRLRVMPKR